MYVKDQVIFKLKKKVQINAKDFNGNDPKVNLEKCLLLKVFCHEIFIFFYFRSIQLSLNARKCGQIVKRPPRA